MTNECSLTPTQWRNEENFNKTILLQSNGLNPYTKRGLRQGNTKVLDPPMTNLIKALQSKVHIPIPNLPTRVVIYNCRAFLRLATQESTKMIM